MKKLHRIEFYLRKEKFGWLSNFHRAFQNIGSIDYKTNEHYYQSKKAKSLRVAEWIKNAPNPYLAMQVGRALREGKGLVDGWNKDNEIKVHVMITGLRAKFTQNADLKEKLLLTGKATLHEASPTDMFWGMKGKDVLGKFLMRVREELQAELESVKKLVSDEEYAYIDNCHFCRNGICDIEVGSCGVTLDFDLCPIGHSHPEDD